MKHSPGLSKCSFPNNWPAADDNAPGTITTCLILVMFIENLVHARH